MQDGVALDHAAHARPEEPRRAVPNGVPVRACGPAGVRAFRPTDKCGLWHMAGGPARARCRAARGSCATCERGRLFATIRSQRPGGGKPNCRPAQMIVAIMTSSKNSWAGGAAATRGSGAPEGPGKA